MPLGDDPTQKNPSPNGKAYADIKKQVEKPHAGTSVSVPGNAMAHGANVLHELNSQKRINENSSTLTEVQVKVEETSTMCPTVSKTAFKGPSPAPIAVVRRNARERNRVKQLNNGYATLRSHIPASVTAAWADGSSDSSSNSNTKKLSKVETLKLAVEYIKTLQLLITNENQESNYLIDPNIVMGDLLNEQHQLLPQHHSPENENDIDSIDLAKVENVENENGFDCPEWWSEDGRLS